MPAFYTNWPNFPYKPWPKRKLNGKLTISQMYGRPRVETVGASAIRKKLLLKIANAPFVHDGVTYFQKVNCEGGIGHDRNLKWLIKRGMVTIERKTKYQASAWFAGSIDRCTHDIRYTVAKITDEGLMYLTK